LERSYDKSFSKNDSSLRRIDEGEINMWAWLRSVKDKFNRRFNWSRMQPSEMAAEQYFVEQDWKFERFGWDRTKIRTRSLPLMYRFMPDYVVDKGKGIYALYECKGMSSRGAVLRLKVDMYDVLEEHYTADLELRILAYALPSEVLYDVPFSAFERDLGRVEEAHDGAVFLVFPLSLFEEYKT